jgi:hypothetical protein
LLKVGGRTVVRRRDLRAWARAQQSPAGDPHRSKTRDARGRMLRKSEGARP